MNNCSESIEFNIKPTGWNDRQNKQPILLTTSCQK